MKFSGINLLDELAREELADLRGAFNTRNFAKGQVVYAPDEEENLVFVIAKGRVRVYLAYEDKEFTLGILSPGDIYSSHAGCFIQAFEDAELMVTDVHSVKRLMAKTPVFTRTMVRVLGQILQNAFSIIGGLAFKDIYDRLMDYILIEAREFEPDENGGVEIRLGMTVEQLSGLLGASRQTVSSLLGDMERAGLMRKRGRGLYYIPDVEALERAAQT